ncbi:hypothetical protein A2415_02140 [candidate division WWE3 bacterium RIFOXYC1_FULL_39_7]|uniref:Mannosyl-glycoprotein endo-beta-N-acetylglucosamidase-like domain-containing protein n=2 Tax=Katanobacteria TaxID=422282 RepID=A0A1F4X9F7_UNCKA|nr:MAG: hypothetical protein A2415_02140 [candidate division WWE3 bacterium RIFOXYC1_FULL_39_7]OGC78161.1 MAG: hypothetical protein A2619_01725 [candidate division WWE3 bacterium RIFOXYD1_FULL_39_9]
MNNKESITSIQENISTLTTKLSIKEQAIETYIKFRSILLKRYYEALATYQGGTFAYKWIVTSLLLFTFTSIATIIYPIKITHENIDKYSIYSSKPLTLGGTEYEVYSKDSRSQKINEIFKEFNCPLEGLGEVFVYEADRNHIPWWIVASIAFQESSCGKMTPEPGGVESYNAWGWGVYGENVQMFDNWVRGIETVSSYLRENFYSQNIKDTCEIMKTYTPPSKGSWCEGVNFFGQMIQEYKTPISLNL